MWLFDCGGMAVAARLERWHTHTPTRPTVLAKHRRRPVQRNRESAGVSTRNSVLKVCSMLAQGLFKVCSRSAYYRSVVSERNSSPVAMRLGDAPEGAAPLVASPFEGVELAWTVLCWPSGLPESWPVIVSKHQETPA